MLRSFSFAGAALSGAVYFISFGMPAEAAEIIDVNAFYKGNNVQIGTIAATVSPTGAESGIFTFAPGWGKLDTHLDFGWYQIITADDCPAKWGGGFPPLPVVDPPAGGWDYQLPTGDDFKPFYWNDAEFAANHVEGVSSSTSDNPRDPCSKPGQGTFWETFLVAYGYAPNAFDVLAGYDWSVGTDGSGNVTATGPTIAAINLGVLNIALEDSGFGMWTAETGVDLPEPSALTLMFIPFVCVVLAETRRARRIALRIANFSHTRHRRASGR